MNELDLVNAPASSAAQTSFNFAPVEGSPPRADSGLASAGVCLWCGKEKRPFKRFKTCGQKQCVELQHKKAQKDYALSKRAHEMAKIRYRLPDTNKKKKDYAKKYNSENREKLNKRLQKWRQSESGKTKTKIWRRLQLETPEKRAKINLNKRIWRMRAGESWILHCKNYYQKVEKPKLFERRKTKEFKAKRRFLSNKRRAKKLGTSAVGLKVISDWEIKWKSKLSVRCYWCDLYFDPKDCHSDHIVSLKNGGLHEISNLCISCANCNLRKNSRPLLEWNFVLNQKALCF